MGRFEYAASKDAEPIWLLREGHNFSDSFSDEELEPLWEILRGKIIEEHEKRDSQGVLWHRCGDDG